MGGRRRLITPFDQIAAMGPVRQLPPRSSGRSPLLASCTELATLWHYFGSHNVRVVFRRSVRGEAQLQKKKRPRGRKLASNLQRHASELAAAEARRVPWQLLWEARNRYLEWQEFYHWSRSIIETEHGVPNWLAKKLDELCPGFLESENQYLARHSNESSRTAVRLGQWIDHQIFSFAKQGGWFLAITFYATVNRWRATLRKVLRMARRWKVIETVPEISRLKGERERSFVFTEALRKKYDEVAPEPLSSFIQISCEIGICEGEIIDLLKTDVHMSEKADEWGHYGYVQIRQGKTEFRKRSLADHASCQRHPPDLDGEIEI